MKRKTLFKIIATVIIILVVSSILLLRGTPNFPLTTFTTDASLQNLLPIVPSSPVSGSESNGGHP